MHGTSDLVSEVTGRLLLSLIVFGSNQRSNINYYYYCIIYRSKSVCTVTLYSYLLQGQCTKVNITRNTSVDRT